jgi:Protein of unknown function (DUF3352)
VNEPQARRYDARSVKLRLILIGVAVAGLAAFLVACGEGADSGGGETRPDADPATVAPANSLLFVEAVLRPAGELKANVQALAKRVAGVDDLGELIASELESSAEESGEELDFGEEIAPWLGERGGVFFRDFDGEDFHHYGIAIQTTDAEASQDFINSRRDGDAEEGSYKGSEYAVESDEGTTVGMVGDFVGIAEDEATFKAMVDADSAGKALTDDERFTETFEAASAGSFADVYVDVGALIDRSGEAIDPEAKQFLDAAGIEPAEATAVASLIPETNQIEVEISSDLAGENPPREDTTRSIEKLPYNSTAALVVTEFGDRIGEALDQIDADGIPGEVPPGTFKSTLKQAGVDVDEIAGSISDLGVYAEGYNKGTFEAAAVMQASSPRAAQNSVSSVGMFLRATGMSGVTAVSGKFSGFSIRDPEELGPRPLFIAARDKRIAVAYGYNAVAKVLGAIEEAPLSTSPTFKEAVKAFGDTPISGFVHGPSSVSLASSLVAGTDDEADFEEAKPYLEKIGWLAIGSTSSGDLATARVIVGVEK